MDIAFWSGLFAVLGGAVGASGGALQARMARAGQRQAQMDEARRSVYGTCAAALMTRFTAADVVMKAEEQVREKAVREGLQALDDDRSQVMQAVGAVFVEGPATAADRAKSAVHHLDEWVKALETALNRGLRPPQDNAQQWSLIQQKRQTAENRIDQFAGAARTALHGYTGELAYSTVASSPRNPAHW